MMKNLHIRLFSVVLVLGALCCGCRQLSPTEMQTNGFTYPLAHRDSIVDIYHGTKVPGPYRWLEDPDALQTQNWVAKQNKLTSDFLSTVPVRRKIETRLKNLMNYPRYSVPYKQGGRYFFRKNDGLQNQSVLYSLQTLDSQPAVVINPNLLSTDGTIALRPTALREDATLPPYAA
ncbi:MAG: S9 family peptidase, partial [Planctomycetes bacterium]|nr:S9 family peptidase [Planctomycetota bacterium]